MRTGKAGAVAGGEDQGIIGAAVVVDDDAVLCGEPGRSREPVVGRDADPDHDEIGRDGVAGLGFDREPAVRQLAQRRDRGAGADVDAAGAMARVDEGGGLLVADARENARRDLDHRGLDAELGRRCRDLQSDQAATDHGERAASMQMRLERARFGLVPQIVDAALSRRKHRQHAVDRAGGEHQRVVADAPAVLRDHYARRAVDLLGAGAECERTPLPDTPLGPAIGASWGAALPVSTAFDSGGFS